MEEICTEMNIENATRIFKKKGHEVIQYYQSLSLLVVVVVEVIFYLTLALLQSTDIYQTITL